MIIYGVCNSCNNHLDLEVHHESRDEILKSKDPDLSKNCNRCGVTNQFKVNDLKAKLPKRIRHAVLEVIAIGLLILITALYFLNNYPVISTILLVYTVVGIGYIFYTRKNFDAVLAFNKSKV